VKQQELDEVRKTASRKLGWPRIHIHPQFLHCLFAHGFDRSTYNPDKGSWLVRCSQCNAMTINGNPSHEDGCPNKRSDSE
jgi:hypothetical protein